MANPDLLVLWSCCNHVELVSCHIWQWEASLQKWCDIGEVILNRKMYVVVTLGLFSPSICPYEFDHWCDDMTNYVIWLFRGSGVLHFKSGVIESKDTCCCCAGGCFPLRPADMNSIICLMM